MLSNLPIEIVLNIASNLCYDDKFQLMLTCRALQRVIQDKSLYERLLVMGGFFGPDIKKVLQKFKSKKLKGEQVKQLEIDLNHVPDEWYSQLPTLFPNVQEIMNEQDKPEDKRPYSVIKFLRKWKDTIQRINMQAGYTHIIRILERKNNTFPHLRRLRISPYIHTDFNMWKDDVNVLACLRNAPALMELHLYDSRINIEFLEGVHESCPVLEILVLLNSIILTSDDELPQPITPAEKLTYLSINGDTVISDDNCVLLDYFVAKYPNLENLGFFMSRNHCLINHTVDPMDAKPRAMWLHEDDDFPVIQTRQVDFRKTNNAYRDHGAEKFLARLPKSMKNISLDTNMFKNIIENMAKSEYQLKDLDFSTYDKNDDKSYAEVFFDEQDLEFLKAQTRLELISTEISASLFKTAGLLNDTLKTLHLSIKGQEEEEMQLCWILEAFPSLEELKIVGTSGPKSLTMGDTEGKSYPNLKKLKILNYLNPSPEFTKSIGVVAPNIKKVCMIIGEHLDKHGKRVVKHHQPPLKAVTKKHRGKSKAKIEQERKEMEEEQKELEESEKTLTIDFSGLNLDIFHMHGVFETRFNPEIIVKLDIKTKDNQVHTYYIKPCEYNLLANWYFKTLEDVGTRKEKSVELKTLSITCDSMKEFKLKHLCGAIKL